MANTTPRPKKKVSLETLDHSNSKKKSRLMRGLLLALVFLGILGSGGFAAYTLTAGEELTSRYTVVRLDCAGCATRIEKALDKLSGVTGYEVNFSAQTVTVDHHSRKVDANEVKLALESARFGVIHEGTTGNDTLAAIVNGKPVFTREMVTLLPEFGSDDAVSTTSELFFDTVAREILLQAAGDRRLLVNNRDLQEAVNMVADMSGRPFKEVHMTGTNRLESPIKYQQVFLQRKALLKYKSGQAQDAGSDSAWIAGHLKTAAVEIKDPELKRTLEAELGTSDWTEIWPAMISKDTELLQVLAWQEAS